MSSRPGEGAVHLTGELRENRIDVRIGKDRVLHVIRDFSSSLGTGELSLTERLIVRRPRQAVIEPVLVCVALRAHPVVDAAAVASEDQSEGRPKISIESSVNDGITETVGVTQPEKKTGQPVRNAGLLFHRQMIMIVVGTCRGHVAHAEIFVAKESPAKVDTEGFDEGQDEEWQPAEGERSHYDAESFRGLAISRHRAGLLRSLPKSSHPFLRSLTVGQQYFGKGSIVLKRLAIRQHPLKVPLVLLGQATALEALPLLSQANRRRTGLQRWSCAS